MSIYDSRYILCFCCAVAAVLGAVFGSFLNCAAYRIAHGQSFLKGRSRCPECLHELTALDLIPILSYIFLRGRCRHCNAKVSPRYLITELFFALVTVLCLLRFDLTVLCLRNWVFICCLFCLSLVDLESFIIPDGCLIAALAAWVCALPFLWTGLRDFAFSLIAAVVFGGGMLLISLALDRILKKESMGGGDIKLFAVCALYLGLIATLFSIILACVLGLLFALARRKLRPDSPEQIPFGPSIACAAAVMLFFSQQVADWYRSLIL